MSNLSFRQAQDWPKAENALKQLIAAAPDTTRWDFYMALGEAQSKSNKLAEAVQTYDKGLQVAQSLISGSSSLRADDCGPFANSSNSGTVIPRRRATSTQMWCAIVSSQPRRLAASRSRG